MEFVEEEIGFVDGALSSIKTHPVRFATAATGEILIPCKEIASIMAELQNDEDLFEKVQDLIWQLNNIELGSE